jgi:hypothetical protein
MSRWARQYMATDILLLRWQTKIVNRIREVLLPNRSGAYYRAS